MNAIFGSKVNKKHEERYTVLVWKRIIKLQSKQGTALYLAMVVLELVW